MALMPDDDDPRVYMRLLQFLRDQIASGAIQPGTPAPSITALCKQFGCARQTAAKPLRILGDEGILIRYPGMGYYVAEHGERPLRSLTVADFDASRPSIARVYDYWLGGKDNFAADRDLGDHLMGIAPELPAMVQENRNMLTDAVRWATAEGITQFIDLGCGLPTEPSTHDTARTVLPDARIAYVDNDPIVINHLSAVVGDDSSIALIDGDAANSGTILAEAGRLLDLSRPVCLLMGALVHFYQTDAARDLVAQYASVLASGSYVVLTAGYMPPGPDAERFLAIYSAGPSSLYIYPPEEILSFLSGLEVLPPGVADTRVWRPGWKTVPQASPRAIWMNGVMARVPGR
jgi:DNA-binding transcriptional regulator YhcF (GntR family)